MPKTNAPTPAPAMMRFIGGRYLYVIGYRQTIAIELAPTPIWTALSDPEVLIPVLRKSCFPNYTEGVICPA